VGALEDVHAIHRRSGGAVPFGDHKHVTRAERVNRLLQLRPATVYMRFEAGAVFAPPLRASLPPAMAFAGWSMRSLAANGTTMRSGAQRPEQRSAASFGSAAPATPDDAEADPTMALCARSGPERSLQSTEETLVDYLVGNSEHGRRNDQAECPSSIKVDSELEHGRLLYRQIGRLGTFKYLIHIARSTPI
jgi:hypothetical protein